MLRRFVLSFTHLFMLALGFALGVYTLPILTAPKGPDRAALQATAANALFKGRFDRNLKGSDFLHWGEGEISVMRDRIAHEGRLAPGPDYKLYLTKQFVETRADFLKIKSEARLIGDVKTFRGFLLAVPLGVDVSSYTGAVIWCEAFGVFISAARFQ